MSSIKKVSGSEGLNEKKAYEPPRAMRLGDMRGGAGFCHESGSSDNESCYGDGNSAGGECFDNGSSVRT